MELNEIFLLFSSSLAIERALTEEERVGAQIRAGHDKKINKRFIIFVNYHQK